jgi:hypothetical protein
MNPATDPLYAGISGARMSVERFDLGHGLVLTRTFAHFMAPFLMAFSPATKGESHPGPWSAVSSGIGSNIHIQLYVPDTFEAHNFFDRLNTVWWVTALMRLRIASCVHVPAIADRPFSDIPADQNNARILPIEVLPRHLSGDGVAEITDEDLLWLKASWLPGGHLMGSSATFNDAFQALDAAGGMPTRAVALLAVWGALEHLFSPAKQELRFRVSANIATYIEPPGAGRLALHRRLMKLYDARSTVAHGTKLKAPAAWAETHVLANRVLMKILAEGRVPCSEVLEGELFAPHETGI